MDYIQCRKILRNYFSDILYIDDEFDTELVDTEYDIVSGDEIPDNMPLDIVEKSILGGSALSNNGILEDEAFMREKKPEKESSAIALMNIMEKLNQEEFSDINLMPVVFDGTVSDQFIIDKMMKAHLTIIDWNLGHKREALPIVKAMLDQVARLKVIVVYTNGFQEACSSAEKIFVDIDCVKNEKHIRCLQFKNKSLVFIVDRMYLNIRTILDEVENIFIQENGVMPVAVLNIADRLQEKSGNIFGSFCKPFEDVYFLQMFYSEVDDKEISRYLSDFIIRKIYSDINIDEELGFELLKSKKNALISVLQSDNLKELIHETITELQKNIPECSNFLLELQKDVKEQTYVTIASNLKEKQELSWKKIISVFKPMFKEMRKKYIEKKSSDVFGDEVAEIKEKFKEVYCKINGQIEKDINLAMDIYKKDIFPVFLQRLITRKQFLESLPELVENLKYHKYDEIELESYLRDGIDLISYQKSNFLMNKIHFGDILYNFELKEYLLCITPPCDAFRPQKIDYKYTFIKGQVIRASEVENLRKENIHITVYPIEKQQNGRKEVKYISWKLFELVTIDLEDKGQYKKLYGYKRYYKLDEIYTRQIANKFISHFSRAGVEEVFVKNEKNLISVFS